MSNKEKHICDDCIHIDVCECAVSNENMFICGSFIDKKVLERPQGKWKALDYHTCYCTNCHFDFDIMKCDFMAKMTFCPNCGADMRGEKQ